MAKSSLRHERPFKNLSRRLSDARGVASAILRSSGALRDCAALSKAPQRRRIASEPEPMRRIPA